MLLRARDKTASIPGGRGTYKPGVARGIMERRDEDELNSGGYGMVAKRSLAKYLIDKFADPNTILISDVDFIYNTTNLESTQGIPWQRHFTCYVTITDGSEPNAEQPSQTAKLQPKVIVGGYSISASPVEAGSEFIPFQYASNTFTAKTFSPGCFG